MLYPMLACSKCATAMLVILIQPLQWLWTFWIICALVVAWAIAAISITLSQCTPVLWRMGPGANANCIDQYSAQIGIRLVDIVTDVVLAVLPGILFTKLQMGRSKRAIVALLFAVRLMYALLPFV